MRSRSRVRPWAAATHYACSAPASSWLGPLLTVWGTLGGFIARLSLPFFLVWVSIILPWQRVELFGRPSQAYSIRAGPGRVPGQSVAAASGPQTLREAEAGAGAHARLRGRTDAGVAGDMDGSVLGADPEAPTQVALQPGGAAASLFGGGENAPGAGEFVGLIHRPDGPSPVTCIGVRPCLHLPERKNAGDVLDQLFCISSCLFAVDRNHWLWSMAPQGG